MMSVSSIVIAALLLAASTHGLKHLAKLGEVPYLVSIWQRMDTTTHAGISTDFQCAGVLLTSKHVLTTVNCIKQSEGRQTVVSAGIVNRGPTDTPPVFRKVVETVKHGSYNPTTKENDLAMLTISPAFDDEENVRPIALTPSRMPTGTTCKVAGWRYDFFYTSDNLQADEVVILEDLACLDSPSLSAHREARRSSAGGGRLAFAGEKLCVGKPVPEECIVGDEGGPLVCGGYLVGIYSSYGLVCQETSPEPSLYHDLDWYRDWIETHAVVGKAGVSVANATLVLLLAIAAISRV